MSDSTRLRPRLHRVLCAAAFTLLAAPLLSACSHNGDGPTVSPPIRWDLVWSDEFNAKVGTPPDPTTWTHDVGGDGWGNNQLEHNTNRIENVAHDGAGHLAIIARKERFENNDYTSARIKSEGKREQKYGRIEARILLPRGQGIWPAFWMLGGDFAQVGWPQTGEIDIMEYRGQERGVVHGSLHGPQYSGGSAITRRYQLPDNKGFDEGFHVFAVEWDPGRIAWTVDGTVYQIVNTRDVTARGPWVFDHPFFILLNVAVGGGFSGNPDATTTFPQTMLVDYVRIFERRP